MTPGSEMDGILSPLLQKIRIKKALHFIEGKTVLDIGCSGGDILEYLPSDIKYIGLEGNKKCFEYAKKAHPGHRFINSYLNRNNVDSLNIPKVDSILMLAVLEHIDDPVDVLRALKKYLSQKGRIIITMPSNYSEWILKTGAKIGIFGSGMHEHKRHPSKKELFYICQKAGLKIIKYSSFELGMNHLIVLENPQND